MAVPVTPGRWRVLGRRPVPPCRRFACTPGRRTHDDLVRVDVDRVEPHLTTTRGAPPPASAKFRKGAVFDKFRPFVANGLVNSEGSSRSES